MKKSSETEPVIAVGDSVVPPIYIDLGTRRKKAIRALSRGEGVLAAAVEQAVSQVKAAGKFANQPVVVVVRERPETIFDLI